MRLPANNNIVRVGVVYFALRTIPPFLRNSFPCGIAYAHFIVLGLEMFVRWPRAALGASPIEHIVELLA